MYCHLLLSNVHILNLPIPGPAVPFHSVQAKSHNAVSQNSLSSKLHYNHVISLHTCCLNWEKEEGNWNPGLMSSLIKSSSHNDKALSLHILRAPQTEARSKSLPGPVPGHRKISSPLCGPETISRKWKRLMLKSLGLWTYTFKWILPSSEIKVFQHIGCPNAPSWVNQRDSFFFFGRLSATWLLIRCSVPLAMCETTTLV